MSKKYSPLKPTDRILTYEEAEEFIRICEAEDARKMAEYVGRLEATLTAQQRYIEELEDALREMELLWPDSEESQKDEP